jgi:hypothetical protein
MPGVADGGRAQLGMLGRRLGQTQFQIVLRFHCLARCSLEWDWGWLPTRFVSRLSVRNGRPSSTSLRPNRAGWFPMQDAAAALCLAVHLRSKDDPLAENCFDDR